MKITLHRALSELKTTRDRINKKIDNATFVYVKKGNANSIGGKSISEIEAAIRADYDSIKSLIENYYKLSSAIHLSNSGFQGDPSSLKKYSVCGKNLTVEEIITRQTGLSTKGEATMETSLLRKLTSDYTSASYNVEHGNRAVNESLEDFLTALANGDKTKLSAEDVTNHSKTYHENNDYKLVDPLNASKLMGELTTYIEKFRVEADSVLSEANALTSIEVDLTV